MPLNTIQLAGNLVDAPELRHTFVAFWIRAGANPKEVSVRAGHSSVAFTLDRYGHLYEDAEDEIPERLDALINAHTARQAAPKPCWILMGNAAMHGDLRFCGWAQVDAIQTCRG